MRIGRWLIALELSLVGACAVPSGDDVEGDVGVGEISQELTAAKRRERLELIRDSAREVGVYNAALIGGIAVSETNLAHCWSEATYACKGPDSPSCEGGPVIAGAADGPCSDMQGGLGMFQFDSGTYAQTIAAYGERILTVEGNTAQVVAFLAARMEMSIDGVTDWMSAVNHINAIPLEAGTELADEWAAFLACRYNGCCSQSATCVGRGEKYRDNGIDLFEEMGANFWRTADACSALPEGGIIETRSECYLAGGDPRYWTVAATGHGDASETTGTTAREAPANFARWKIPPIGAHRARIEAYVADGTATAARYELMTAAPSEVTIDQTAVSGWAVLADDVEIAGDGSEYIQLGDNTGTAMQVLAFDAVRITLLDEDGDGAEPEDEMGEATGCGCATGGSPVASGWLVLVVGSLLARRRGQQH